MKRGRDQGSSHRKSRRMIKGMKEKFKKEMYTIIKMIQHSMVSMIALLSLEFLLNKDIDVLTTWFSDNFLQAIASKTQGMTLGSSQYNYDFNPFASSAPSCAQKKKHSENLVGPHAPCQI